MFAYLQREFSLNLRRDDVRDALAIIYGHQGRQRRPQFKPVHRRQAIFPGPNKVWSVDGHSKLQNWGIDIYAAIDAYSRKIIWIFIGPSGLTQVTVAKQYLLAIKSLRVRPQIIRSDRGSETSMMADLHYSLEVQHQQTEFNHNQATNPVPLRQCYMYGKSTTNQRIESFWLRLIVAQTGS